MIVECRCICLHFHNERKPLPVAGTNEVFGTSDIQPLLIAKGTHLSRALGWLTVGVSFSMMMVANVALVLLDIFPFEHALSDYFCRDAINLKRVIEVKA